MELKGWKQGDDILIGMNKNRDIILTKKKE
jgi:hypothetical protein